MTANHVRLTCLSFWKCDNVKTGSQTSGNDQSLMKNVFSPNQLVKTSTQLLWMLGDAMICP